MPVGFKESIMKKDNSGVDMIDKKRIKVEEQLLLKSESSDVPSKMSSQNMHSDLFSSNVEIIKVEPLLLWEVPGLCQLPMENSDSFHQTCHKQTFHRKADSDVSEIGEMSSKEEKKSHVETITNQLKIHSCSCCDKNFKRRSDLNRHILTVHEKKKDFKCSSCNKGFCSKCHLSRHTQTVHKSAISDSDCLLNNTLFCSGTDLARLVQKNRERYIGLLDKYGSVLDCNVNQSITKKLRTHKCSLCEKAFTRKSDLFRHTQTVHEKTKAFKCGLCEKDFGWKSDMYRHIQTVHEKIKAYECFFCDKNFSKNSHLTRHIQTVHEKLKPFKCSVCEKDFGRKGDLSLHFQVVHEKRKVHKCNLCEKGFSQKSHLTNHILVAHENVQVNKCSICDKNFSKNSNLYRHIHLIHKKKALNL